MAAPTTSVPFIVVLMGLGSVSMLVPAFHAILVHDDFVTSRVFLYGAILFSALTLVIGLATNGYKPPDEARSQLLSLLGAYAGLPVMFAIPFQEAAGNTTFLHAWFEMVSSFTTTGATLYGEVGALNPSLHLWRALVGWMGGLLIWITAIAILAPMNIGGFEVRAEGRSGEAARRHTRSEARLSSGDRLKRYGAMFTQTYCFLTLALFVALLVAGEIPIVAICHAMSVMATSGISPIGGLQHAAAGIVGEMIVLVFLLFALSRLTFTKGSKTGQAGRLRDDPELRLGLFIVVLITCLLFLRHFLGAIDQTDSPTDSIWQGVRAFWGAAFTVLSFLTTTGFESFDWTGARVWSGLETPGLILIGVALIGGGVATTAGGVKLLRIYALIRHGEREANRLVHPHSIGGGGREARRIRRQGAYISWIFFMLVALTIALVMLLLSLADLPFESAMVFAVAAISTTGPLPQVAAEVPIGYNEVSDFAKGVLAVTMVLGRLETLALISLLNPDFWRR